MANCTIAVIILNLIDKALHLNCFAAQELAIKSLSTLDPAHHYYRRRYKFHHRTIPAGASANATCKAPQSDTAE